MSICVVPAWRWSILHADVTMTKTDILRLLRPNIREMLAYEPIEPPEILAERFGIPREQIVKLDANENPYGPSPKVLEALGAFDGYHRYGDAEQRKLRARLGDYTGVPPECIVAGHGSDELIDLLLRAALDAGDGVIDCPPTFGMYSFSTRVAGGRLLEAPRRDDFTLDVDAVRKAAPKAKVVFVASPNNPTGNMLSGDELEALLATGLLVVVDEAYSEFAGESFAALTQARDNLVVLRTFSKWAGLAGLRAGYGIMPATLAEVLMHMKPPYTPNIAAEVAMLASLEDRERLMDSVQAIIAERERMSRMLSALEFIDAQPSRANFLLCRLNGWSGGDLRDGLAERGVFVRYFDTPRLQDYVRISVGTASDTDRLAEALGEVVDTRAG